MSTGVMQRLSRRRLVIDLGESIAYRIMDQFGGHRIPRPDPDTARLARDRGIRQRLSEGIDPEQVAADYGLSVRQVLRIDQVR